jgi:hypothetical protein
MTYGLSWIDNLTISPEQNQNLAKPQKLKYHAASSKDEQLNIDNHYNPVTGNTRYYQKPLPEQ